MLVGCPNAAELEDPNRFAVLGSGDSDVPAGCEQALPDLTKFSCDVPTVLRNYCARGGCHNSGSHVAGLDLTADERLIARVLEVPAKHAGTTCPGNVACVASMDTCEKCDTCPENALLVDRDAPDDSWILKKMEPFIPGTTMSNVDMRCGDSMPSWLTTPSAIRSYDASHKQCLTDFFREIATNTPDPERWPCTALPDGGTDGGADGGT